jgi:probable selenium-dependent hydroxylase accessory protein YqeC
MQVYGQTKGKVLELGSFAGGISFVLAAEHPELELAIADERADYLKYLRNEIFARGFTSRIKLASTDLDHLTFSDDSFDLVILRGAFFFIMDRPRILEEIYRVLKLDGVAFVGGGYGKDAPPAVIAEIAAESSLLNDRLGRRRVAIGELKELLQKCKIDDIRPAQFIEEGGLWLLLRKASPLAPEELTRNLKESLDLRPREVISLVGGGGKTTIMFALAQELAGEGKKVITTTTTRILKPTMAQSPCVVVEVDEIRLISGLREALSRTNHVTLARLSLEDDKLMGLLPETVDKIASLTLADYIINEADGATRQPIKAPNATEPVIPVSTSMVIAVVGMDALNQPLSSEIAFRPELISEVTGLNPGEMINPLAISKLLTHARGIIQYTPHSARIVPFINKFELHRKLITEHDRAEVSPEYQVFEIVRDIFRQHHPRIHRVVLGAVGRPGAPLHIFQLAVGG